MGIMVPEIETTELAERREKFCNEYLVHGDIHLASILSKHKLMDSPGNSFFVYLLCDPRTSKIFYVGKGKNKRPYHHLSERRTGAYNIKKLNAIKNIRDSGFEPEIYYIAIGLKEQDAFSIEREVIKKLGKANLTNITSGINKQTQQDMAREALSKLKTLSRICSEKREPWEIETYLKVVREYKMLAA